MGFIKKLPLTKLRIYIAKILYKILTTIGFSNIQNIKRRGINFHLDISEGIDLNIFLFGGFQGHVFSSENLGLNKDSVIIDIGANIGSMTLEFAKAVQHGQGRVISFEPTDYAFEKLRKNVSINPMLEKKVTTIKAFVSSKAEDDPSIEAYSSWSLSKKKYQDTHPLHLGKVMPATQTKSVTLDWVEEEYELSRVDFIKIDTDGHELDVLNGAKNIIRKYKPALVFECGGYILTEKGQSFKEFIAFFDDLQYQVLSIDGKNKITLENYTNFVPPYSTVDFLAKPKGDKRL